MAVNFDKIVGRNGTNNYKWDKLYERYNRNDLLPFWIADSELESSQKIIDGLVERARHGIYGYTFRPCSYYEAIEKWLYKRHNWSVDREWITSSSGVVPALSICIESYTDAGDSIIVFSPAYPSFYNKITESKRKLVTSNLVLDKDKYLIDFEDFEKKIKINNCKMLIFCNPHNPAGRVWTHDELVEIGKICLDNGVRIVSDDIHCDIVYTGSKYIPISKLSSDLSDITITCMSAGKTFNLTGLAASVIIIPNKNLRDAYNKVLDRYELADGNLFGNLATEIAYSEGEAWLDEMLKYIENNRNFLVDYINKGSLPLYCVKPEGTYMALINCSEINLRNEELFRYFIDHLGLVVNSGHTFGENTDNFVRFNFACSLPLLKEGLNRLNKINKN